MYINIFTESIQNFMYVYSKSRAVGLCFRLKELAENTGACNTTFFGGLSYLTVLFGKNLKEIPAFLKKATKKPFSFRGSR